MQVWNENMVWYDRSGPDADHVRDEVEQCFWKTGEEINFIVLGKCLNRIIPDTRDDFGSWRVYASFYMKEKLVKQVKHVYDKEMERVNRILSEKFIPYVLHYLYKPKGFMMTKCEEDFNNKKNILRKK